MDHESDAPEIVLPVGVTIRTYDSGDKSIQVAFSFKGLQCREILRERKPNAANIRYAGQLVSRIRREIVDGTFDYLREFPNSKSARTVLGRGATITVAELLDDYIAEKAPTLAPSTVTSWRSMIEERIKPGIGKLRVRDLATSQIIAWLKSTKMAHLSLKFVRNVITPLRGAMFYAIEQEYRIDNPAAQEVLRAAECVPKAHWSTGWEPDPLNPSEVEALLAAFEYPAARNLFAVAFETGLRTGELVALKWRNIDLQNRLLTVDRAIVEGYEKSTKTPTGRRTVDLSDKAISALSDQLEITGKKTRVFCDPRTQLAFTNSRQLYSLWVPAVRNAQIRFRPPMQTRHTYASRLITEKGVSLFWLASQLGHRGTQMINRHYGRWIEANPTVYPNGGVGTATGRSGNRQTGITNPIEEINKE